MEARVSSSAMSHRFGIALLLFVLAGAHISITAADGDTNGIPDTFQKTMKESETSSPFEYFRQHFSPYEPIYIIWMGGANPTTKFQYSFRYSLFNPEGSWVQKHPWLKGPHFAFTQTSLWDLGAPSSPFFDSSYKPEAFYLWEDAVGKNWADWFQMDLQAGFQHESNGKSPPDSRSANTIYFKPRFVFGRDKNFQFIFSPRAWLYVSDLDDNPDLPRYRGYFGAKAIIGWAKGVQLSAEGRIGNEFDRGAVQIDSTVPLSGWTRSNLNIYLHAQVFLGYGESFLRYKERQEEFRIGLALTR